MASKYTRTTVAVKNEWRLIKGQDFLFLSGNASGTNGTTNILTMRAGTVVAKTPSGDVRPCGFQEITSPVIASDTLEVDSTANFYVGDDVEIMTVTTTAAVAEVEGVLGEVTDLVIGAGAGGPPIVPPCEISLVGGRFDGKAHRLAIAAAGGSLTGSKSYGPAGVLTWTITPGAATTCAQLVAYINEHTSGEFDATITTGDGSDLPIVVAATPLVGAVAPVAATPAGSEAAVAGPYALLSKTGTELVIDTPVTVAAGSIARVVGAWKPVGVLEDELRLYKEVDGVISADSQNCTYAIEGLARKSKLIGHCDAMDKVLIGGVYYDEVLPIKGIMVFDQ